MVTDRPSSTAKLIARSTLLAAYDPLLQKIVPENACLMLGQILANAGSSTWFFFALRHEGLRKLFFLAERILLPGIILHYLARKKWLQDKLTSALEEGCEQVVVIGAGFDTLLWRTYFSWPAVLFVELDHPATQKPKAETFSKMGVNGNLVLQAADLQKQLPSEALRNVPRFDRQRRTCFIAEGLFMYIPEPRLTELLRDISDLSPTGIAFTFMEPDSKGRAAFRDRSVLINAWLRTQREPFSWAIRRDRLDSFLQSSRFKVQSVAAALELRETVLMPLGLSCLRIAEGECLCYAVPCP